MSEEVGLSEAPLATFEIDEFCEEFTEFQEAAGGAKNAPAANATAAAIDNVKKSTNDNDAPANSASLGASSSSSSSSTEITPEASSSSSPSSSGVDNQTTTTSTTTMNAASSSMVDNFNENFSGSLEDLVSTFDEKITKCFCNFDETTEKIAPVQVGCWD